MNKIVIFFKNILLYTSFLRLIYYGFPIGLSFRSFKELYVICDKYNKGEL